MAAAEAAALRDALVGVSVVAVIEAIVLLIVGWLVAGLPVGECDQCPHCSRDRRKDE